ncbi:ribonuclease P protein component [Paraflavitalea pollutisoli]|uniref:ribonuclease P protein component n=1 Tax=Paraflavitalea pollutisoli TaxID=3034143 RepID=UPI0023EACD58|nr:ribonuclease P protein component [Paraflavitalea sp. H1-2-19X]
MVKKFTLGSKERLKSRKLIDQVFAEGKNFNAFPFRVYYLFSSGKWPIGGSGLLQCGVGVSTRNFKHSVDRNRIKRLTREAYRQQKNELQELIFGKDCSMAIFLIYTGRELPDYGAVTEKIGLILNRLIKAAHEIPSSAS